MAGHSKWANIQHRKGRQDAARSKLFSKLAKEITIEGILSIQSGDNPRVVEQKLKAFISPALRDQITIGKTGNAQPSLMILTIRSRFSSMPGRDRLSAGAQLKVCLSGTGGYTGQSGWDSFWDTSDAEFSRFGEGKIQEELRVTPKTKTRGFSCNRWLLASAS